MQYHIPKAVSTMFTSSKKEKNVDIEKSKTNSSASGSKSMFELEKTDTGATKIGIFILRGKNDNLPQRWWFASTAIPLLAATIGPLANVFSIAALVTEWRAQLENNGELPDGIDGSGVGIPDPQWELTLNAVSLACGCIGNIFLLCNFTKRIRYIISLPMTIISWFIALGILAGVVIAIHMYTPPIGPGQTYSQGYWYAVLACILYTIGAVILMINMLGYFLGHYPQHFELDDSQRTLIIQSMLFFFWLAIGAGIFSRLITGLSYANALYYCDVTILTIGFGDFSPTSDPGRGFVIPYAIIGIIFLGLMIDSISKFAAMMSKDKVIKAHALHERVRTLGRTVTNEKELRDRLGLPPRRASDARRQSTARKSSTVDDLLGDQRRESLSEYGYFEIQGRTVTFHEHTSHSHGGGGRGGAGRSSKAKKPKSRDEKMRARSGSDITHKKRSDRRRKLLMLKEEKDRFDAMRDIQHNTHKFKQYYALGMSFLAFGILWGAGAVIFMLTEQREQNLSYFDAFYFCFVSLLTIGYGDFSPKSNIGKPFFVVWSLIAIPTMTILISDLSKIIVTAIDRKTFTIPDWTVIPEKGAWHDFLVHHPRLKSFIEGIHEKRQAKMRLKEGFDIANPDMDIEGNNPSNEEESTPTPAAPTLEQLAEKDFSEHDLARKLSHAIKRAAHDLHLHPAKKYCYEEWVEFTRLIRFSAKNKQEVEEVEEEEGLVEWDWIGEDSPMLADVTEAEWILDRLCESLNRYSRKQARLAHHHQITRLRIRNSLRRLSTEKERDEEQSGSASGSSNAKVEEKSEHWQRPEHEHGHGPKTTLVKVNVHSESKAVREWEAKISKHQEDAKRAREAREHEHKDDHDHTVEKEHEHKDDHDHAHDKADREPKND